MPTSQLPDVLWYVSYGSNMSAQRFRYYLQGGTPPGTSHVYPGARDQREPQATAAVMIRGAVYFALQSKVWGGGMAFYEPDPPADWPVQTAARAYLLRRQQFSDVAAQEMHRAPGLDLHLDEVLAHGRAAVGPGRYETLVSPGELDGVPMVTFTAPWRSTEVQLTKPSPRYLDQLAAGLREAHGWTEARIKGYLNSLPGACPS